MAVVAGGYTVTPAKDADGDAGIRWVLRHHFTGRDQMAHSKIVNTNINTLNVDLNWGDTTDSIRLRIYTRRLCTWSVF